MPELLYEVGVDPTPLETGVTAIEARLAESGVRMAEAPAKYAKASAAAFEEIYASEGRLDKFRKQAAFDRMTDQEKVATLQHEGLSLLAQIQGMEGASAEKSALMLEYEKKKSQIFDLNKKITAESTTEIQKQDDAAKGTVGTMGSLNKSIENLKKGFKDMGVDLKGAGLGIIFAAVVSLGKEAIENAQKQRDEYERIKKPLDMNTASLARFGDALDSIKGSASKFVGYALSGWTLIGDSIGSAVNRMRGLSEAQEKYAEQSQKAADIAQKRIEKLKEEQHNVDAIASATKNLEEARRQSALNRATDEQKFALLLAENIRLREQLKNTEQGTVLFYERQQKLLENGIELNRQSVVLAKQEADIQQGQLKSDKDLSLTYQEKSTVLAKERNVLLQELQKLERGSNDYAEINNKLDANGVELIRLQREHRRAMNLDQADMLEMVKLQIKLAVGGTDAERGRFEVLKLQKEEKKYQAQIEELIIAKLDRELNPAEEKSLKTAIEKSDKLDGQLKVYEEIVVEINKANDAEKAGQQIIANGNKIVDLRHSSLLVDRDALAAQADLLQKQIESNNTIISTVFDRTHSEGEVTVRLRDQNKQLQDQLATIKDIQNSWGGVWGPLGLHNLGNISTDVLNAMAKQKRDEMDRIVREYDQKGYSALGGNARRDNFTLQSEIDSIASELSFRQDFVNAYNRGGRAEALQQYVAQGRDAASFDVAFANMNSWASGQDTLNQKTDQISKTLTAISGQLSKSGIFPGPS
jgi:hypothetical protein